MKWHGPIKPAYIALPDDLHRAMRSLGITLHRKAADMYVEAATRLLERHATSYPIEESEISLSGMPDAVVQLVRNHSNDPRCLECIFALGRIWDVGDDEVKDAITRNCRVFARASEALKGTSDDRGSGENSFTGRVGALLGDEARGDTEIDDPEAADRHSGGSRGRVPGVGEKPARKGRKRG